MHQIYCDIEYLDKDEIEYFRLKCIITNLNTRNDSVIYFNSGHITVDLVDMYKHYYEIPNVIKIVLSNKFDEYVEQYPNLKWINFSFDFVVPEIVSDQNDLKTFYNAYKNIQRFV